MYIPPLHIWHHLTLFCLLSKLCCVQIDQEDWYTQALQGNIWFYPNQATDSLILFFILHLYFNLQCTVGIQILKIPFWCSIYKRSGYCLRLDHLKTKHSIWLPFLQFSNGQASQYLNGIPTQLSTIWWISRVQWGSDTKLVFKLLKRGWMPNGPVWPFGCHLVFLCTGPVLKWLV